MSKPTPVEPSVEEIARKIIIETPCGYDHLGRLEIAIAEALRKERNRHG